MTGFATGALSGANQTTLRSGYSSAQYAILDVPTVALSFNPSANNTAPQSASIAYSSALSGGFSNVKQGMVVLITPSSDYVSDWNNKPNECFFGYVRKTPTASGTLAIGLTAFQWTTSSYVTVLTTFYPQMKPYIIDPATLTQYKDYDLSYRLPLPRIENLQSAYVVVTATSTSVSLAPSATSEGAGSISSYRWTALRGNVTLSSTTASSITVTVDAGESDWVYLVVTDSNGVSNWFATFIAGVSKSHNSPAFVNVLTSSITHSLESGSSASFTTEGSLSTVMNRARCVVYSVIRYNDGTSAPLINNIDFVGHVQSTSVSTEGSSEGVIKTTSFEAEGLNKIAERLTVPELPIRKGSMQAWDYLGTLTVWSALWHVMSEHTQYPNLSSITRLSNHADFKAIAINTPKDVLFSVWKDVGGRASIVPSFARSGETNFARHACLLETTTLRNNLTTIATLTTADVTSVQVENDSAIKTGQIVTGASWYISNSDDERFLKITAPKVAVEGATENTLNGQILTANATDANALAEGGARGANLWALDNRAVYVSLSGESLGAYRDYPPTAFQWWKITYPTTENNRGLALTSSIRFLLIETSEKHDHENGAHSMEWRLLRETTSADYGQTAEFLSIIGESAYPPIPTRPAIPDFELDDPYFQNPNNPPVGTPADTIPADLAEQQIPPPIGCENFTLTSQGNVQSMAVATISGQPYKITINGEYKEIASSTWCVITNFVFGKQGWTEDTSTGGDANWSTAGYWYGKSDGTKSELEIISPAFTARTITAIQVNGESPVTNSVALTPTFYNVQGTGQGTSTYGEIISGVGMRLDNLPTGGYSLPSPADWCVTFDFADGDGGAVPRNEPTHPIYPGMNQAVYTNPTWRNVTLVGNAVMTVDRYFDSRTVTGLAVSYTMSTGSPTINTAQLYPVSGPAVFGFALSTTAGTFTTSGYDNTGYTAVRWSAAIHKPATAGQVFFLNSVYIQGLGTNPFTGYDSVCTTAYGAQVLAEYNLSGSIAIDQLNISFSVTSSYTLNAYVAWRNGNSGTWNYDIAGSGAGDYTYTFEGIGLNTSQFQVAVGYGYGGQAYTADYASITLNSVTALNVRNDIITIDSTPTDTRFGNFVVNDAFNIKQFGTATDTEQIRVRANINGTTQLNKITGVRIEGLGTCPPELNGGVSNCIPEGFTMKDAFYEGYETGVASYQGTGQGLQIDKGSGFADVSTIPQYSVSHVYEFIETGNGNAWDFKIGDSDYTDNRLGWFITQICGGGL